MLIHNCHITVDKSLGPSWKTSMTKKDKKAMKILQICTGDCQPDPSSSLTITDHSFGLFRHAGGFI